MDTQVTYKATQSSPLGQLTVTSNGTSITSLRWRGGQALDALAPVDRPELTEALSQLDAYFDKRLTRFDLPLEVAGSDLQRAVCDEMRAIAFGDTSTYGDIAARLGVPAQAIGQACGGNPIPVIIPCHRVLGATGLGGFSGAGGVETKVWLLRHEGAAGILI